MENYFSFRNLLRIIWYGLIMLQKDFWRNPGQGDTETDLYHWSFPVLKVNYENVLCVIFTVKFYQNVR